MGALDYLADKTDPRVIAGLKNTCGIFGREPTHPCLNPQTREPLGRMHLDRTQKHFDKRTRRKVAADA